MTIPVIVLIIALILIIIFFKNFNAFVYAIAIIDIFLRIVTYLKTYIIKDSAFGFLNYIPESIPAIIGSFNLGMFNDILMFLYVVIYMIFLGLLISKFVNRKF